MDLMLAAGTRVVSHKWNTYRSGVGMYRLVKPWFGEMMCRSVINSLILSSTDDRCMDQTRVAFQ